MRKLQGPYAGPAAFLLISAALHLAVLVVSGVTYFGPILLGALIWAVVGLGLGQSFGKAGRWLAWLAFLLALAGGVGALGFALSAATPANWIFWGIVVADVMAALGLLGILWSAPGLADEDMA